MTTRAVSLSSEQVAHIERQAHAASPFEWCGALTGSAREEVVSVTGIIRLTNSDRRPDRFSISDSEIRRAQQAAAEQELELVGIVHTHPSSPADPSQTDRESMKHSRYPWLIVGISSDGHLDLKAFASGSGESIAVRIE